ncbi:MAG TPA: TolC family protein, partial [Bacteroidales bacterium]|nr:TolC family protein [Bacteroidales bacterium]
MRYLISISLFLVTGFVSAQDTLYFKDCVEASIQNAPRWRDKKIVNEQQSLVSRNIKTSWYPQLELNGKASYQSDVVSLQFDQPGMFIEFPEMPHEQYGLNLDIKQMIYDGGLSREKMKYEAINTHITLQEIQMDLHKIKEITSKAYFTVLLFKESRNALEVSLNNLNAIEKKLVTSVENGAAREADLKLIRVEILKVLQQISEIDAGQEGMKDLLRLYTSIEIDSETVFETPFLNLHTVDSLRRP